jgi:hypothetical protein
MKPFMHGFVFIHDLLQVVNGGNDSHPWWKRDAVNS